MKTEKATTVYAQWDRRAPYDVIKHMITTDIIIALKALRHRFLFEKNENTFE